MATAAKTAPLLEANGLEHGDAPDKRALVHGAFFTLGAASCITHNSVIMAVAYFRAALGTSVLAQIALAYNVTLLGSMGYLIFGAPRSPSLAVYSLALRAAMSTACLLNCALVAAVLARLNIRAHVLLPLVSLNGFAAGLTQGLGASLGGLFDPYSFVRGCSSQQLAGSGFGVLMPTLTQLALLPRSAAARSAAELRACARMGAVVSAAIGGAVCVAGLLAVQHLRFTRCWRAVDSQCAREPGQCAPRPPVGSEAARANPAEDTVGKCAAGGYTKVLRTRLTQLRWCMLAQLVNEFSFVSLMLLSPALPTPGAALCAAGTPSGASGSVGGRVAAACFWRALLPTVLLIAANVVSFAGRVAASFAGLGEPRAAELLGPGGRASALVLLVAVCVAAPVAAAAHMSAVHVGRQAALSPWVLVGVFGAVSFASGFSVLSLSQLAQRLCGHSLESPCEITAQFTWASINVGAFCATLLSLAVLR